MTANAITISHHATETGGEYRARSADGEHAGELTWTARGENIRVATHTGVPREMRGRGIADELVQALIADARKKGFTIEPACSYVARKFDRNPNWSELRA